MRNTNNLFENSLHRSVVTRSAERVVCTCCGSKQKRSSMVSVYYNLLKKSAWHCQKCMSVYQDNLYHFEHSKSKYFIEFFSGSRTVTKVFQEYAFKTFSSDIDPALKPDFACDILKLSLKDIPCLNDVFFIWASVPCTTYSVLSLSRHWKKHTYAHRKYYYDPISKDAKQAIKILHKTLWLIEQINPVYYIIENPRGALRHMLPMQKIPFRYTVSYNDFKAGVYKPTDLFHNIPFLELPQLKTSVGAHFEKQISSMYNAFERSVVPEALVRSIVSQVCRHHHL